MNVKVGDDVVVFDINRSRVGHSHGGYPGTVVKVGRKLFTVEYGERFKTSEVFRLEDGRVNDNSGHRHVETLEEAALNSRRASAVKTLRGHRVELRAGNRLTLEQIEALAEVARSFTVED